MTSVCGLLKRYFQSSDRRAGCPARMFDTAGFAKWSAAPLQLMVRLSPSIVIRACVASLIALFHANLDFC
jgi:hypothetical protein